MHRLSTSFVLGYHGCDHEVAEKLLRGDLFLPSTNPYDWLGGGTYFWEVNPKRGLEFVTEMMEKGLNKVTRPAVVGAVIDLGNCLDLVTSVGLGMAKSAYEGLAEITAKAGTKMPENRGKLLRHLDCAVIDRIHKIISDNSGEPIDTVRGFFSEGVPLYPTSGFDTKTHIQIAVRNLGCIKGVFRVPEAHLEA